MRLLQSVTAPEITFIDIVKCHCVLKARLYLRISLVNPVSGAYERKAEGKEVFMVVQRGGLPLTGK